MMPLKESLKIQGDLLFKYRSYWPAILAVSGGWLYTRQVADPSISYEILCVAISLSGVILRMITIGHTAHETSGRNTKVGQIANELNTSGMYSVCRNPLYLGNYLIWLGVISLTQHFWFWLTATLLFWIYYERIIYAEEVFLSEKFGSTFEMWANKTPLFFPKIRNWINPVVPFNWKKMMRQEKAGVLNLFLVIYLFHVFEQLLKKESLLEIQPLWSAGMAIALTNYLVIKVLQKYTSLLED